MSLTPWEQASTGPNQTLAQNRGFPVAASHSEWHFLFIYLFYALRVLVRSFTFIALTLKGLFDSNFIEQIPLQLTRNHSNLDYLHKSDLPAKKLDYHSCIGLKNSQQQVLSPKVCFFFCRNFSHLHISLVLSQLIQFVKKSCSHNPSLQCTLLIILIKNVFSSLTLKLKIIDSMCKETFTLH